MSPNVKQLAINMANFWWRIRNLYFITDSKGKKIRFKPNKVQVELFRGLHNKTVVLKARQFG